MIIAISGTREKHLIKTYQIEQLYSILNRSKKKNWLVHVGDCPTGIDQYCIEYCKANNIQHKIWIVKGERTGQKLRQRTIDLIEDAKLVCAFPKGLNAVRSGTWLATWQAVRNNKRAFVIYDKKKVSNLNPLPKIKELDYWQLKPNQYLIEAVGIKQPEQQTLFKG